MAGSVGTGTHTAARISGFTNLRLLAPGPSCKIIVDKGWGAECRRGVWGWVRR